MKADLLLFVKAVGRVVYIERKQHTAYISGQDVAGVCLNLFCCLAKKAVRGF